MSPKEINITIAKICGWKDYPCQPNTCYALNPLGKNSYWTEIPDYFNSLDAINEAEKIFVQHDGCVWGDNWEKYTKILARICLMAEPANCLMRATASQRAEAFIETFKL